MPTTPSSLYGTETENPFDVVWGKGWPNNYSAQEFLAAYFPQFITLRGVNGFLENGGRAYDDLSFIEFCTAETQSLQGLLTAEKANELLFNTFLLRMGARGIINSYRIRKRVLDDAGNSWAYHENYLYNRHQLQVSVDPDEDRLGLLKNHLASRNIFTGAGGVRTNGEMLVAQKALTLATDVAFNTTHQKPLINTRDKPYANPREYGRLHIICGDDHVSYWAKRLQIGATDLVIRMAQAGIKPGELELPQDEAYLFAKLVARDTTYAATSQLKNGKKISALNLQEELFAQAKAFCEENGASDDDNWTLAEWGKACSDMRQDPECLNERSDSMTRHLLIAEALGSRSLDIDALQHRDTRTRNRALFIARTISQEYETIHTFDPKKPDKIPLGAKARQEIWGDLAPDDGEAYERMRQAPEGTRGRTRGDVLRKFGREAIVQWHKVELPAPFNDRLREVRMPDPYHGIEIENV